MWGQSSHLAAVTELHKLLWCEYLCTCIAMQAAIESTGVQTACLVSLCSSETSMVATRQVLKTKLEAVIWPHEAQRMCTYAGPRGPAYAFT